MIEEILQDARERMDQAIEATRKEFAGLRSGRANPALLDRIEVEYYGTKTPLNQLATVSAPDPRQLLVQPWDKGAIKEIEKAIIQADLGFTPASDGALIRIAVPQLTEERRKDLVRLARKTAEEMRVQVRNIRREANDEIRALEKEGEVSEDDRRRAESRIQELTDSKIKEIDALLRTKEEEVMEV